MKLFHQLKIGHRIVALVVVSILAMVALVASGLLSERDTMMVDRRAKVQDLVSVAYSSAAFYAGEEKTGRLSREDA